MKKAAVYMDHFMANIFEYKQKATLLKTITSAFNKVEREKIIQKGESHLHNKEQDFQNAFYLNLIEEIKAYDEVLLFGSTTAKAELNTILNNKNGFEQVTITIKNTEKLTSNQQISFINDFFYIE